MNSNITIHVVEPGGGVPVPDTGLFTSGIGGPETMFIGGLAIILVVLIMMILLAYRHSKKQGRVTKLSRFLLQCRSTVKNRKSTAVGLSILALMVSVGTFAALVNNGVRAVDADSRVVIADDADLTIELGDEPVFAYVKTTVAVDEAMPTGYKLKAYTTGTELKAEGVDKTISLITKDSVANTYGLKDNTWGLSVEEPTAYTDQIFYALPETADDAVVIKAIDDYSATEAGDTTTVYYGFYITPDLPYGTYTGAAIDYVAEKNGEVATVIYDGNGLYFNDDETQTENVTKYIVETSENTEKYSHTENINGEGTKESNLGYGTNFNEVVKIPGATKLGIRLTYGGGFWYGYKFGYLSFWQGSHPDYRADQKYELGVQSCGDSAINDGRFATSGDLVTVECEIPGNEVTFNYWTENGGPIDQDWYGYYAVVTGYDTDGNLIYLPENKIVSGEYLAPDSNVTYRLLGWDEDKDVTIPTYASEEGIIKELSLTLGAEKTLYAIWSPVVSLNYNGNNATAGSMETYDEESGEMVTLAHEDLIMNDLVNLYAPNYKKTGYGFVGWSLDENAWDDFTDNDSSNDPIIYGPNQTFAMTKDIALEIAEGGENGELFAVWAPAKKDGGDTVYLQNWHGCNELTATIYDSENNALNVNKNSIIALTDERDNNVYTIARLSDGNCWMVENMRLDSGAELSSTNTNNPSLPIINGFDYNDITTDPETGEEMPAPITSNHLSVSSDNWDDYDCWNYVGGQICFNLSFTNNFNTNLGGENTVASYNGDFLNNEDAYQWYSYGNYYNFYSATAGNGTYDVGKGDSEYGEIPTDVAGDVCPAGWELPRGMETGGNGSFAGLSVALGGSAEGDWGDAGKVASGLWRSFPNNFIYGGFFRWSDGLSPDNYRGENGYYWSSTAMGSQTAQALLASRFGVNSNVEMKVFGASVRCVLLAE